MRLFTARFLAPHKRVDVCSGHGRACGATGDAPSSNSSPSLPRGRSDQLPSGVQLSSLSFFIGTLRASMSLLSGMTWIYTTKLTRRVLVVPCCRCCVVVGPVGSR